MKRLILLVLIAPLFLFNCFIFDAGNRWGKSLITLSNLPPGIAKVHVIVYDNYPQGSSNAINVTTLTAGSTMSITVPAGDFRYFLIVAENTSGFAEYTGLSGPYSIGETGTVNVVVAMNQIVFNIIYDEGIVGVSGDESFQWDLIPGADHYVMSIADFNDTEPESILGITPLPIWKDPFSCSFWVQAYFSILDIYSILSPEFNYG